MEKKIILFGFFMLFGFKGISAQETFKVMFYNLLNYPLETAVPNRINDLNTVLSDYQPDLFMVCELNNVSGANTILNLMQTNVSSDFQMATFVTNTSDDSNGDQNDLQNLLYYDSSKFIIEQEIIIPTDIRDFNIYKLKLNTTDQAINPIYFYAIICHLKASSGTTNAQKRFEMIQELELFLEGFDPMANNNVILGGDLNLYTSSENAFQELLDGSNVVTFADPVNRIGSWHTNSNYLDVFTQSTRTTSSLGGASGGFDDRFDFILTSENILTPTNDLRYVSGTYESYGNNNLSSCYNRAINSSDCGNASSPYSQAIRDALHNFSDHLPVVLTMETDATFLSTDEVEASNALLLKKTLNKDILTVFVNKPELFNKSLMVVNSIGQNVMSFKTKNQTIQEFDISGLQNGLYFLAIQDSNIRPVKFIVAN